MPVKNKSKTGARQTPITDVKARLPGQTLPNWPPLTPLLPSSDLEIEETCPNQILTIRNLFTSTLCKSYISYLSTLPLTTTPGQPRRGEALRVNDRYQVDDFAFAQRLWEQTALKNLCASHADQSIFGGEVVGLNPNIRIYRYRPGQFFDRHYDESNRLSYGADAVPAKTTWTLLIYLSTCGGGETIFYPEARSKRDRPPGPIVCGPEAGMALLHRHGDDCMIHEGAEVTDGEKWVLRSDLVVKR